MTEAILLAAAGFAGFIDAIVGGGGLVLLPAMFTAFPGTPPATLFGTNKAAQVWGTAFAAARYARQVKLNWSSLLPAAALALVGSFAGAALVSRVPADGLRQALPLILLAVLIYIVRRPNLGQQHAPRLGMAAERGAAAGIGGLVGFYDGFFGPGTGSFFVFLLVRVLGYDFLHASASAKLLNTATNLAAISLFASQGQVWWQLALMMAVANVAGSFLGTRLALQRGAGFVRMVFIIVVAALILKTGYDAWGIG
jgi:uncharacterized protein